jgi:hypothetical protein
VGVGRLVAVFPGDTFTTAPLDAGDMDSNFRLRSCTSSFFDFEIVMTSFSIVLNS